MTDKDDEIAELKARLAAVEAKPAPARSTTQAQAQGCAWLVIVLVIGVLVVMAKCHRDTPEEAQAKLDAPLISAAKGDVRERLKDPGSAQFGAVVVKRGGAVPVTCGLVNAKNGFGGYVGDRRFVVVVRGIPLMEADMDEARFAEIWLRYCGGV